MGTRLRPSTMSGGGPEPLWGPKALAVFLNIPVATVYSWRYRGGGPPGFRVGRHVRYRPAEVMAWLQDQRDA